MSTSDMHTRSTTFSVTGTSASYAITTVKFTVTVGTEGNDTGIDEVKGESGTNGRRKSKVKGIYDLQGREVANPVKGIYIIDGKKVFVK